MVKPSVMTVYEECIWTSSNPELGIQLYGNPPKSFGANRARMIALLGEYDKTGWHTEDRLTKLENTLRRINRELGSLTPKVEMNIKNLHNGAIEAGHQSVVLGGPAFILNKAATVERVAVLNSTDEHTFASYFFVADYDVVQNELTHIRTPLMGSGGTVVTIPVPEGFEHSPVSMIPLPGYSWYEEAEESIKAGYRPLFKVLEGSSRSLFEERLEECFSVVRHAFINSTSLGDWAARILASLFNIHGNLGLPLLSASDGEIRELLAFGMELLLQKENRLKFIRAHEYASSLIESRGYETGIGRRRNDYVPFYYECSNGSCNRSRTELSYIDRGTRALLQGKCPSCGEKVEIEIDAVSPDLSEVARFLSPRVDTRQLIIDTSFPIVTHVGGPGETAYYAQVIPIAREIGHPFPLYVKYPRVYYNTPWSERLGKELQGLGYPILHRPEMFRPLGKIARFRKKGRIEEMNEHLHALAQIIDETYFKLNDVLNRLSDDINQKNHASSEELQRKMDLERYLSWAFGQYTEGKISQESSWAWIDWAINAGFADLFGPYERAYVEGMRHGAKYFVNFMV